MPAPVRRLLVKFQVWGKMGSNIWYEDLKGKRQFVDCLEEARKYAHKAGYDGIVVRAV